jgi:hypothetical protein
MGYDHFALLATPLVLDDETDEKLSLVCKELRNGKSDNELLFGHVHHLCAGSFNKTWWWTQFDDAILKLYEGTRIEIFYIYTCEFDGENLTQHKYTNGKKTAETRIELETSNPEVGANWNMESTFVKGNITILYNDNYPFDG